MILDGRHSNLRGAHAVAMNIVLISVEAANAVAMMRP